MTLTPTHGDGGSTYNFMGTANDGVNEEAKLILNIKVSRTDLQKLYYYLTVAISIAGGVSLYTAYEHMCD